MSIRVLGATDVRAHRALLAMFGAAFADRGTYCDQQPTDEYIGQWLANPSHLALVAECGDEVIGGLAGYVLPKFEQARSEFYIYDLAVAEPYRRRGVATRLIEALRREAQARGIYVIFVQADHGDDPAVALYTKLGVREDVMHFDIQPAHGAA